MSCRKNSPITTIGLPFLRHLMPESTFLFLNLTARIIMRNNCMNDFVILQLHNNSRTKSHFKKNIMLLTNIFFIIRLHTEDLQTMFHAMKFAISQSISVMIKSMLEKNLLFSKIILKNTISRLKVGINLNIEFINRTAGLIMHMNYVFIL